MGPTNEKLKKFRLKGSPRDYHGMVQYQGMVQKKRFLIDITCFQLNLTLLRTYDHQIFYLATPSGQKFFKKFRILGW